MNIVVVGGGTAGRFGNDFVRKAAVDHNVLVLSHKNHNIENGRFANFSSPANCVEKFRELVAKIDTIDLLLYNSNMFAHPNKIEDYTSKAKISEKLYHYGFNVHVVIPHLLCIEALNKMNGGRIVFMTTDCIYERTRIDYTDKVGYYGGKAYLHQLMLSLAHYNDKNVTVSSLSPYFPYNDKEKYKIQFQHAYDYAIGHVENINGTVHDCWLLD